MVGIAASAAYHRQLFRPSAWRSGGASLARSDSAQKLLRTLSVKALYRDASSDTAERPAKRSHAVVKLPSGNPLTAQRAIAIAIFRLNKAETVTGGNPSLLRRQRARQRYPGFACEMLGPPSGKRLAHRRTFSFEALRSYFFSRSSSAGASIVQEFIDASQDLRNLHIFRRKHAAANTGRSRSLSSAPKGVGQSLKQTIKFGRVVCAHKGARWHKKFPGASCGRRTPVGSPIWPDDACSFSHVDSDSAPHCEL